MTKKRPATKPSSPKPHLHGGDPGRDLARFGLSPRPVLDLSANLSPLGPPAVVKELWADLWREIECYPSLEGEGIKDFYEERFALSRERVLPGNGATELIYLVPRALKLAKVAIVEPSYNDYRRASLLAGAKIFPLALSADRDFAPPDEIVLTRALSAVDALFVGHPNNPTGTLCTPAVLRQLAEKFPEKWFLLDESFIQFTEGFPETSLAFAGHQPPNVLVFHSLTKFYALAGLRLGSLIAAPDVVLKLRSAKEPWTVNGVADRVARKLAGCREYESQLQELIRHERPRMERKLAQLPGLRSFPSPANFILAQRGGDLLDELLRSLLQAGVCIRDCRNFPGLEDGYFRFAVRGREENDRFLAAFEKAVEAC